MDRLKMMAEEEGAEKKISLVKILCILIICYSLALPILSYYAFIPAIGVQNEVLIVYWTVGLISYYGINKYPQHYKYIFGVVLVLSYLASVSALYNVPDDDFRAIWFYLLIIIAFYIGGRGLGSVFSLFVFFVLLTYYFSSVNTIDKATFTCIIISLVILVQLSFYFTAIMKKNEQRLFNYQHNLEFLVNEKLDEIDALNNEIITTQQEVIYTLSAIGETRSNETGMHVKRVAEYSYLLARLYGLTEEQALTLKLASPMHDIGKIGIKDAVLNKKGKLTDAEFEVMKRHTKIGHGMLMHSQRDIFKCAAIISMQHHEKYDGTGYPDGLKGDDIHIYGRITALADVFDALGSRRIYKKPWSDTDVFNYLKAGSGKQFDPQLIKLFFDNLELVLRVRHKFAD